MRGGSREAQATHTRWTEHLFVPGQGVQGFEEPDLVEGIPTYARGHDSMISGRAGEQQQPSYSSSELSRGKFIQRYSLLICLASSDPRDGSYQLKRTNPHSGGFI